MMESISNLSTTEFLRDKYEGEKVRVYTDNGAVLIGQANFCDGWVRLDDTTSTTARSASISLDHVISIAKF